MSQRTVPRFVTVLLGTALAAQEPAPPAPDPSFFKNRRQALMGLVKEGVILLRGAPKQADMATFYQDHEFYYLTGVAEPDLAVLLFPAIGEEILLVPPFNRFTANWEGRRLTPGEESAERTGFAKVGNSRQLRRALDDALAPGEDGLRPTLWTILSPAPNRTATAASARGAALRQKRDRFDGRPTREEALEENLEQRYQGLEVRDVVPLVNELRGVKTAEEIAQIRRATDAACQGIAEAMKSVEPGIYEYQLAAVARYVFSRLGAGADAYAAIVGGGPNGCVLHYSANMRRLEDGDLIVMDYGPTVHGFATDVTRTFPANGRFTAEQRKLVEDVYEVQQALIAQVKPGANLDRLSSLCSRMLLEKGYRVDHGPCHHVGLAVHDKGGRQLEPGMVITVEPGAYLRDQGMGCRIEDTILVTENGNVNLSAHLPSRPDEIEALMKRDGLAQQSIGLSR